MTATLILGKDVSEEIYAELRQRIETLKTKGVTPGLAVVLVGDDPASQVYVRKKGEMCEELGMHSTIIRMPGDTTQEELMTKVLVGKAKGNSVRGVIATMARDDKEALRLQNKYRSMVAHHKARVTEIMNGLAEKNIPYFNPYLKKVVDGSAGDNLKRLNEYVAKLDVDEVAGFLNLLGKLV